MKKMILFFAIILLSFSCEKEAYNEKFIGDYIGTATVKGYIDGILEDPSSETVKMNIKAGDSEFALIIDDQVKATVWNSEFTILDNETKYLDAEENTAVKCNITGGGTLANNGSITFKFIYTTYYENKNYKIEVEGTLNKL